MVMKTKITGNNCVAIKRFFYNILINVFMAVVCWASIAILAGSIATLYALDWYKNRKQIKKSTKKLVADEDYTTKEPIAEQLA
jgi:hypothetical protein